MQFFKSKKPVGEAAAIEQDGIVIVPDVEDPQHIDLRKHDLVDADEYHNPNEVDYYIREMKRYQARDNDDEDDVSYILTITDTNWPFGDPTAVTTSSNKETTVTLLFFTSTTMMWYNPYENYDSSTEILVDNPTLTTITTTASEDENEESTQTSDDDSSGEPTDTATSIEEVVSSRSLVDASTTSDPGIASATGSLEGTAGSGNSDLPQTAIIGISVGISVLTVAIVMVLLIVFRRRHKRAVEVTAAPTGSPSPSEPPKMEEARPAEQPYAQAFASPVVSQHTTPDQVALPRASSAPVSELEQQAHLPVGLGGQQPWAMQAPAQHAAQHIAHPAAEANAQPAAPRQYQAYHPSYSQNQNQNQNPDQGFVAELPAENYTR